jgi:hypothetical protein
MAKKRKTPQKRLKEAIDRSRGPQLRDLLPKPDYSDVWDRRIAADFALTLSDQPIDASLRIAFEIFRLDPKDPCHWRAISYGSCLEFCSNHLLLNHPISCRQIHPVRRENGMSHDAGYLIMP